MQSPEKQMLDCSHDTLRLQSRPFGNAEPWTHVPLTHVPALLHSVPGHVTPSHGSMRTQTRLLVTVGATDSRKPTAHRVTFVHTWALFDVENDTPATQLEHRVLLRGVAALSKRWPGRHCITGSQVVAPVAAWNEVTPSHGVHAVDGSRSESAVPDRQLRFTQAPTEFAGTKVPALHDTHGVDELRSASVVPAAHASDAHSPDDPPAAKLPAAHCTHGVDASRSSSDVPAGHWKLAHRPTDPDGVNSPDRHGWHPLIALESWSENPRGHATHSMKVVDEEGKRTNVPGTHVDANSFRVRHAPFCSENRSAAHIVGALVGAAVDGGDVGVADEGEAVGVDVPVTTGADVASGGDDGALVETAAAEVVMAAVDADDADAVLVLGGAMHVIAGVVGIANEEYNLASQMVPANTPVAGSDVCHVRRLPSRNEQSDALAQSSIPPKIVVLRRTDPSTVIVRTMLPYVTSKSCVDGPARETDDSR